MTPQQIAWIREQGIRGFGMPAARDLAVRMLATQGIHDVPEWRARRVDPGRGPGKAGTRLPHDMADPPDCGYASEPASAAGSSAPDPYTGTTEEPTSSPPSSGNVPPAAPWTVRQALTQLPDSWGGPQGDRQPVPAPSCMAAARDVSPTR